MVVYLRQSFGKVYKAFALRVNLLLFIGYRYE